ncbi:M23 family metallopeptidase [Nocardioides daphniae]|uniref:M23 family metallopeptidase n=1 Tax=Nocardioides daphniae TaxID=402297 RepID=A0A4P7UBL3_9ACTN|nr:M23 family metallopeptidase [Nocardioides daphniae]QCC76921.1 M23 family metallopeptidase [Nocardioides daphniae]GGD17724.1 hypothetical protein GCM10007231_15940 [Nocardioides daphniae]
MKSRTSLAACLLVALSSVPGAAVADLPPSPAASGTWPLAGHPRVVQGFTPPDERWGRGHRGVDLAGTPAQQVLAAMEGTVSFVGRVAGRGVVVVSHGGTRTTYEPVLGGVDEGDEVAAGDPIGWLHPTGSHCAPATCLHWGWRRGEEYLDPLTLVGGGPVRLLPLWAPDPVTLMPLSLLGLVPTPVQARGWAWR